MKLNFPQLFIITISLCALVSPLLTKYSMKNKLKKDDESASLKVNIVEEDSNERKSQKKLYNDLLDHMLKNGSTLKKFSLKFLSDNNRYLYATEDIKKGEVIAEIPRKLMLLEDSKELESFKQKVGEGTSSNMYNAFFVWLMEGKKNPKISQNFELYLRMLPKEMSSIPLLFKTNREKELYNSSKLLKRELDAERQGYEKDFKILEQNKAFAEGTTLYDYMEGGKLFESRNFYIRDKEGNQSQTLIPFVDLFNYDNKDNIVEWTFDNDRQVFVIKASNDINKNQEILLDYGGHSNRHFLQTYGFTTPSNPKASLTLQKDGVTIELDANLNLDKALKNIQHYYDLRGFTDENEKKSLDFLVDAIDDVFVSYNSSLEEDKKRLKKEKSFSIKNILRVLIDEKSVLKSYAKAALEKLNDIDKEDPRIRKIGLRLGIRIGVLVAVPTIPVVKVTKVVQQNVQEKPFESEQSSQINNNKNNNKKKPIKKGGKAKKNETKKIKQDDQDRNALQQRRGGPRDDTLHSRQIIPASSSFQGNAQQNIKPILKHK